MEVDGRRGFGGGSDVLVEAGALGDGCRKDVVVMDLSWLAGRTCVFKVSRRAKGFDGRVGGADFGDFGSLGPSPSKSAEHDASVAAMSWLSWPMSIRSSAGGVMQSPLGDGLQLRDGSNGRASGTSDISEAVP